MGAAAKLLIVLATTLGAIAAAYALRDDEEAAPRATARIAAASLEIGTFLDEADAPFAEIAEDALRDEHVVPEEPDVLGAVVIAPVPAGAPVPRSALLTPDQEGFLAAVLRPGMRAVSIAVDAVSGNAGHIFPGDQVDMILTQRLDGPVVADDPGLSWASETILTDVRVIAVDQALRADLAGRTTSDVARTITLEVSPDAAQRIAVARNLGALSLTLRSLIVETADGRAPEETPGAAPVWARDISAVARAAGGGAQAAPQDAEPDAPPAQAAPIRRPVRIIRGSEVTETGP